MLLVTLDTTRADRLGSYGYELAETPVMDRLATEGIRYVDAVSTVPMTLPSHATIFTCLDPPHHGVRANGTFRLDASHLTLAEILQQAGYTTAAFVSSFVLDPRYGLQQGFDIYDAAVETTFTPAFGQGNERSAEAVTNAAIQWLGQEQSEPFFAWIHYFDPHYPYQPPPPFAARFENRLYDGEIAYVDAQLGRLLAALGRTGASERTLVVVAGDHGESLGEHFEHYHSRTIYEAAMRVPLLLWAPSLFQQPSVVDGAVVSLADIFPTLLELLGIRLPRPCDGVSLLRAESNGDRVVFMETLATFLDNGWEPLFGLRRHADKYILAPRPEYYDLRADPNELHNLFEEQPEPAREDISELAENLRRRLAAWPSVEEVAAAATPLDVDTRRRLEALGYVSESSGPEAEAGDRADPKDMLPLRSQFLEARALAQAGQLEEAAARLMEILVQAPSDREARQQLSEIYARAGRLREAEEELRRILRSRPSGDAAVLLAQVLMSQRRFAEAGEHLDRAAGLDPNNGAVLIARGDLLALQGRFEESLSLYVEAEREDPYRATGVARSRINAVRREMARQGGD